MTSEHVAFVGSIPTNYDRYLGPILFEPYAQDIVKRVHVPATGTVLELACGTGIVTRYLRQRLPDTAQLIATDLNPAMFAVAATKFAPDVAIEWKQADAMQLPFPDQSMAAVVCQFGLMFVPDKGQAIREALRVLAPQGTFIFNVWGPIEQNDIALVANTTIKSFFQANPPDFYDVPFGFHDSALIQRLLEAAGFNQIRSTVLRFPCVSATAYEAARGFVEGNPIINAIRERGMADVPTVVAAVADAIAAKYGDRPAQGMMQAIVWQAERA